MIGEKQPSGIDGISYLPTLTGEGKQKKHDYLYFEFHEKGGRRSILKDGWKLIELNVNEPEKTVLELYDIKKDPSETENLVESYPKLVSKLKKLMYSARTENPIWNFQNENK